jgi:hypothetical protein
MDNRLLTPDDEYRKTMGHFHQRSQGSGLRGQKAQPLYWYVFNIILFLTLCTMLIPLVSCELDGGYKELKADELKKLIEDGPAILIVDNRSEYEYGIGHIPKAINIPQERFTLLDTLLPKDKGFPIVFYCTGYG